MEIGSRVGRLRIPFDAFAAEWSVRKASIAWSTLDVEPQMSPPPTRYRGERMLNSCVMLVLQRELWYGGDIEYPSCSPLVRIAGTLKMQRYISEVLEPIVLPYLQVLITAIF
ncbi:hypothetical protein TNCV_3170101 [Trichonephila clavipes]|nr:hypothetical protein TNCV_3170101 [Trichonephila clavipes]